MSRLLSTLGLAVLLVACSKEEPNGTNAPTSPSAAIPAVTTSAPPPAASAPATPSASAALPPPKCPPGMTGNPSPAYCIKLPSSYSVKEARLSPKKGSIEYDTGTTTDNLMVSYDDTPLGELSKQVEGEMKFGGDKLEKKGDLPGGNKWFQGSHGDIARVVTLFKGPPPITLKCSFAYQSKKAPAKDAVDACKSISVP